VTKNPRTGVIVFKLRKLAGVIVTSTTAAVLVAAGALDVDPLVPAVAGCVVVPPHPNAMTPTRSGAPPDGRDRPKPPQAHPPGTGEAGPGFIDAPVRPMLNV
jgi:hypothetical protein